MNSKETLYLFLHYALTEIRDEAHESINKKFFAISYKMQNIPLRLLKASSESDFESILADFEESIKNNIGLSDMFRQIKLKIDENNEDN